MLLLLAFWLWSNFAGKQYYVPDETLVETTILTVYEPLRDIKVANASINAVGTLQFAKTGNLVGMEINGKTMQFDELSTEAEVYQFLISNQKESDWIVLDAVHFKFNKVNFTHAALAQIKNVTAILIRYNPNAKLDIEGFADHIGKGTENQTISDERAMATRGHFVTDGFAAGKIVSALGSQDTQRLCQANDTPVCHALNRRVEIKITK